MSEPRLIEPLLSEHIMGDPISDRCGVRCCPAIHKDSEDKYMVKILSFPANGKQLAALVLSGACKDREDALRYFRELADDAVSEAEVLQKLSRLEGFRSYEAWQVEPAEDGFDVYLLSTYGQTLERYLRRNCLTHLSAVNLGLDLCAALSVCRRNGYLYVDLKPENIFLSENQGFLIGDLGFIRLSSLKYASLPDKYRSAYTPPEIEDAYSALSATMDVYATGLILYQVYNNGQLPSAGEELLPPEYADYEMAEIILKACAQDPSQRWQDPQEMAQALVSYMQTNAINDDPIIPPVIIPEPEMPAEDAAEELAVEEATGEELIAEEANGEETDAPEDPPVSEETEEVSSESSDLPEEPELPAPEDAVSEYPAEVTETDTEPAENSADQDPVTENEPETVEQITIDGFLFDDSAEDIPDLQALKDAPISEEVSQMLAQADDLIAHQTPDPVVAPEPIEIPMPEPILPEPEPEPEPEQAAIPESAEESCANDDSPIPSDSAPETVITTPAEHPAPKRKKKLSWLIAAILVILLAVTGLRCAEYYYENVYLQSIHSITLDNAEDWVNITLDTQIDNSLLTVTCTDTYGNKQTSTVENNRASFTSLPSGTTYKIAVLISGKHQLTGNTTATFTTPSQTTIVGFTGITGDSNGSVILNFSVNGPDAASWLVKYSTEGETEQTAVCTGHMALITGLTPGESYDFRLVPQEDLYLVGGETLTFTASNVICAEDLTIHGFQDGALTATWSVPEGEDVDYWTVRCYNSLGVDLTFTVDEPSITISDLDISQGYTLDVLAGGMTVSRMTSISAGSVSFKDLSLDDSVAGQLTFTWTFEGTAPADGWTVVYTVDGSAPITSVCEGNSFTLDTIVPGGVYTFSLLFPSGTSVYGNTPLTWTAPEAKMFQGHTVDATCMNFRLCIAPMMDLWDWHDVPDENYTNAFASTDTAAVIIRLTKEYQTSPETVVATFVIRDENGAFVSIASSAQTWTSMWYQGYCELNLPALPTTPGAYTVEIYFDGAYITAEPLSFTVS